MLSLVAIQSELATQLPQIADSFADVLAEITNATLSPAQKRLLEAMNRKQSDAMKREMQ
jgi:hypothetical protein